MWRKEFTTPIARSSMESAAVFSAHSLQSQARERARIASASLRFMAAPCSTDSSATCLRAACSIRLSVRNHASAGIGKAAILHSC